MTDDKFTILAVDDVAMNQSMLEFMLADVTKKFLKAGDGRQAIDILSGNPDVDIILLDLEMPVMDGFETLTFLKQSEQYRDIPVVVITAGKNEILRTLSMGANDFLPKPFNQEELKLRVTNHARSKKLYDLTRDINKLLDSEVTRKTAALEKALKHAQEVEEEFRQAQKMEAIGTLAGGIAHDFNNILAAVIGFTELAGMEGNSEKRNYFLDQVLKAGNTAKSLVAQILTFSRKEKLKKRPVHANVIVKECIKLLRSSLPSTIDIRQAIETRPSVVIADPTQIHQVLMNLCTNAFHAMKEKGGILEVTLSHERMETGRPDAARDLEAGGYVKLSVRDTGHGIDPAIRSRIFEPFFTTKQQGEGTGLGMSVVWGIVKSCGGAIDVASEVGVGTTISVYLPLVDSAEPADHDATEEIVGGHERVLFVDDEETLAELGERILGTLGYRVTASSSSLEALELFRGKHREFDLVFADLTMPGMTGVELAGEMLSIRPDIPIILCTGYSESITEERAREIGVRQVVTKPMVRKEIGRVIRDTLSPG